MSDHSHGEGWWLASDGKWYPPESQPGRPLPPPPLAPPITTQPATTVDAWPMSRKLAIGAAAVVVVSTFLPWAQASFGIAVLSKAGIEGDGIFTALCGAIAGVGILHGRGKGPMAAIIAGAISSIISIYYAVDIGNEETLNVGVGLMLSVIASLGLTGFASAYRDRISPSVVVFRDGRAHVIDSEK